MLRACSVQRSMEMVTRRALFVHAGAAAALVTLRPAAAHATASRNPAAQRLALLNTHTGERLDLVVRADGVPVAEAMPHIDRLLRDHRNDATHRIDKGVIDQLLALRDALELTAPFHVISGYRSPATNAKLATAGNGVARDSLHLTGRAIDIRVPGLALTRLHAAALALKAGGVGFYARSDFVHLDTGRVRTW
jgi:uncharacterized protein YcbK (DUF882 family)